LSTDQPVKLCECGCGQPAPIAKQTNTITGEVKGQPKRFVQYHAPRLKRTSLDDFWKRVDVRGEDECWEWRLSKSKDGYGFSCVGGKIQLASRLAFTLSGGALTEEKPYVCHKCDNPSCCNPNHLFAGSQKDNMHDMIQKGRARPGHRNKGKSQQAGQSDTKKVSRLAKELQSKSVVCKRCGWTWTPRKSVILTCPHCKSPYWDRERQKKVREEGEGS
jgi:hypothetical protein